MKKLILFSVLVVGATLLQAQSITVHQTCGQNGEVVEVQAVDFGLSVKWANMNVGAESPEGYGDYFAWGETVTKATYDWSTYFDPNDGGSTFAKYNNEGGKTVLDLEDDAAYVNWGGSWRMPTKAEWRELLDNCTWTWTTQNGINGYKFTSNKAGYTDKFIFLPAAGYRNLSDLYSVGSYGGSYWSSSLYEGNAVSAWRLYFYSDYPFLNTDGRCRGQSVRPVLPQTSISYSSSTNDTIRIYSNGCDDYQTFIGSHGSQLTMTASSDQWSHFVRWQDGNTDNPRTITTNGNADYTAEFAKYIFSITKNAEHGTISGNNYAENLDFVTLTVVPDYGYHFTQWSDGVKDNPRIFQITKDTAFTAEFAIDRSGNCGDNLALTWEYDAEIKALTIKGEGDLCSNYTFGVEAPDEMEKLIISEGVTAIGNGAFANQRTLKHISIASSVKTVYEQAFYNCTGLEQIYSYRNKPAVAYSNTFDGIDKFECTLHVLDGSVDMYKAATGWRDFYYIETIDAETITEEVEEVVVTPTETTANIVWPQVENTYTYSLIIWADEAQTEKICTLIFDAEGHLTGIDFSKKASRSVYTQEEQVAGFSFTVTGLDAGTEYFFNIIAKDEHGDELKTETGSFTTKSSMPMAVDEIANVNCENAKILRNGHLFILRGEKVYSIDGREVK